MDVTSPLIKSFVSSLFELNIEQRATMMGCYLKILNNMLPLKYGTPEILKVHYMVIILKSYYDADIRAVTVSQRSRIRCRPFNLPPNDEHSMSCILLKIMGTVNSIHFMSAFAASYEAPWFWSPEHAPQQQPEPQELPVADEAVSSTSALVPMPSTSGAGVEAEVRHYVTEDGVYVELVRHCPCWTTPPGQVYLRYHLSLYRYFLDSETDVIRESNSV